MARYIVITTLDLRGIPSYYVVDTADNSRVRRYDCEPWAQHEADRMNGITERQRKADKSLLRRLWDALSLHKTKGVQMDVKNEKTPHSATERAREDGNDRW